MVEKREQVEALDSSGQPTQGKRIWISNKGAQVLRQEVGAGGSHQRKPLVNTWKLVVWLESFSHYSDGLSCHLATRQQNIQ